MFVKAKTGLYLWLSALPRRDLRWYLSDWVVSANRYKQFIILSLIENWGAWILFQCTYKQTKRRDIFKVRYHKARTIFRRNFKEDWWIRRVKCLWEDENDAEIFEIWTNLMILKKSLQCIFNICNPKIHVCSILETYWFKLAYAYQNVQYVSF